MTFQFTQSKVFAMVYKAQHIVYTVLLSFHCCSMCYGHTDSSPEKAKYVSLQGLHTRCFFYLHILSQILWFHSSPHFFQVFAKISSSEPFARHPIKNITYYHHSLFSLPILFFFVEKTYTHMYGYLYLYILIYL